MSPPPCPLACLESWPPTCKRPAPLHLASTPNILAFQLRPPSDRCGWVQHWANSLTASQSDHLWLNLTLGHPISKGWKWAQPNFSLWFWFFSYLLFSSSTIYPRLLYIGPLYHTFIYQVDLICYNWMQNLRRSASSVKPSEFIQNLDNFSLKQNRIVGLKTIWFKELMTRMSGGDSQCTPCTYW